MFLKLTGCSSKCEVLLAQWLISSANYSSESVQQTKKKKSACKLAMRNCHGVFVYLSRPRWAARWLWWRPGRTLARFHYSRLFPCQSRALCLTTVSRGVLPLISGNCSHGLECFILFSRLDFALLCVFFPTAQISQVPVFILQCDVFTKHRLTRLPTLYCPFWIW